MFGLNCPKGNWGEMCSLISCLLLLVLIHLIVHTKVRFINENKVIFSHSDHRLLLWTIKVSILNTGCFTCRHQQELSGWINTDNYMCRDADENNIMIWPWQRSSSTFRRKPGTLLLLMHLMPGLALGTQRARFCLHLFQTSEEQLPWKRTSCASRQLMTGVKTEWLPLQTQLFGV